jgi:phage terminase large subunit-like protein
MRRSPLAAEWVGTDWSYLLDTAALHSAMWSGGKWGLAAEIRMRVGKCGATPPDRARLGIKLARPRPTRRRLTGRCRPSRPGDAGHFRSWTETDVPWCGPEYAGAFPSLGPSVVEWIETFLCHGPGDVMGERIDLDEELYRFIVKCYRLDPQTGRRTYRRALLSRPKGRAKSELAGMLVVAEALGPVRFAGWDANGEPVGKPVVSPIIRCLATEETQSGHSYDNARAMLEHGLEHHSDVFEGVDVGLTRTFLPHQGAIIPSTASSAAKDGGRETFAVFDETHLYIRPDLRAMHETVRRNLRKRRSADPWALETSTAYRPGEDSVAEHTHEQAKSIREGRTKDAGLLLDHREAPADTDLADPASLLAGLRQVYGPAADWLDLDAICAEIWDLQSDPSDSRRYWLNQVTTASDAWLSEPEWAGCLAADNLVKDGDVVTLGFDGSRARARGIADATALIGCRVTDGHLFEIGVWEQPRGPAGQDWQVPVVEVEAAVRDAFARFRVVGLYADPARWEGVVAGWEAKYGHKLKVRASQAHPCEWWMTGGRSHLIVRALASFHGAVLAKELTHDGAFALTRHVLNARRRPGRTGMQIAKEHPESHRKIDAAVAAVLAWQARLDAVAKGANRGAGGGRVIVLT